MRDKIINSKRIVIKIGSSTLTHGTGLVNLRRFDALVRVISDIKNSGKEVIIVSSGAMAIGRGKLGMREKSKDMPTNQAAAAVGQGELMHLYDSVFSDYHNTTAQVLLTRDIVESKKRLENVTNTFLRLIEFGCIPIVNENDTVSVEEIEFGDNDNLSAIVAEICLADSLIILSDIEGLFDENPKISPFANLISHVDKISDEIINCAGGAGGDLGTGGMITKIEAAQKATQKGIDVYIINGDRPENLYDLLDGKPIGTHFSTEVEQ